MCVNRHLRQTENNRSFAFGVSYVTLSQARTLTLMNGRPTLQVGKAKSNLTIAAIIRAEEAEQGGVSLNRQKLPVTQSPVTRREVAPKKTDFSKKRFHSDKELVAGGENTLQSDHEIERKIGLLVVVRLIAACRAQRGGSHDRVHGSGGAVEAFSGVGLPQAVVGRGLRCRARPTRGALRHMVMLRDFRNRQRVLSFAADLSECKAGAGSHSARASEIWQAKCVDPVATVGGPKNGEKRLVLSDRQRLSVAQRPTARNVRVSESEDTNFADEWFSHGSIVYWEDG